MTAASPSLPTPSATDLQRLAALDDSTRRSLYEYVTAQRSPVSRDEAASAVDVDRSVAAYHLDKLVDADLLATSFSRPDGRSGPGSGRPAKHYERVDDELAVNLPPRDYRLAAELLARAAASDRTGHVRQALDESAAAMGREVATNSGTGDLQELLAAQGYEPYDDDGVVRLRNCPFHRLAQEHTDLVCGMNLSLLDGCCQAIDAPMRAVLDPAEGRCCVAFTPTDPELIDRDVADREPTGRDRG